MDQVASWAQDGTTLALAVLLAATGLFIAGRGLKRDPPPATTAGAQDANHRDAQGQDARGHRQPPPMLWIWWATLVLLLLWNLSASLSNHSEPVVARIPYSVFVDQLRSGNVSQVAIMGSEIVGKLRQVRYWNPRTGLLSISPPPASGTATSTTNHPRTEPPAAIPESVNGGNEGIALPRTGQEPKPVQVQVFATVFPSSVGDPSLLPLLEQKGVEIAATAEESHWLTRLLGSLLPVLLLLGFFWWMGRRAMNQQQSIFGMGKSQARRFHREDAPRATFADVAGADAAKSQLQEVVEILKAPERFRRLGARTPRGVLLAGPPGTGKTLLARAVAGEAGVPFFSISGSEFVEMFVGVGASRVRSLFKEVKEAAPAILFVDELDAVGRRRGAGLGVVNDEREQTLNQLLVEMDGFDDRQSVIVLAATNRPDVLDPALRRPGRFDRDVVVELPDLRGRRGILAIHTRTLTLAPDVNLDQLAAMTTGMSGAQLANLCNEAALTAARAGHEAIGQQDLERALDKIVLGDERALVLDPQARRVIAYHEAGHALVAWLTPDADQVHKVTIVPHGLALGVTEQRPNEERYNLSRSYLLARIAVMLGGRAAEEIAIGDITTGAENDLRQATDLARRMVSAWGMSEVGLAAYEGSGEDRFLGYELGQQRPYSEATAQRIDGAVHALLDQRHRQVLELLEQARTRLTRLAESLLENETLGQDELVRLLGPRPAAGAHARSDQQGNESSTRAARRG
jgi:cell division protease FtsH